MSALAIEPIPVNVLAVAQRIRGSRAGIEQTSELELVSLAAFVLEKNQQAAIWPEYQLYPNSLPASLAAAVARLIALGDLVASARWALGNSLRDEDELQADLGDASEQFNAAFDALKTRFNQEFPSDGNR